MPRITLRPEVVADLHRDLPVKLLHVFVGSGDFAEIAEAACDGLEIPVYVEGSSQVLTAVLVGIDCDSRMISVVI